MNLNSFITSFTLPNLLASLVFEFSGRLMRLTAFVEADFVLRAVRVCGS